MEVNNPRLVSNPHPLLGADRALCFAEFEDKETLKRYINRTKIIVPQGRVAVWHNGRRVPDKLWKYLIPNKGDQIVIRTTVQGGGGGGGGKVLRTVATIAIIAIAVYTGGLAAAALGGAGTFAGALGGAAVTAAVSIGGQLLVNALLPLPKATLPSLAGRQGFASNQNFALSGGTNSARLWQPMALVFGQHKVVPDLASTPYTEYVGDNNFLNQLFHFGLQANEILLSEFAIGDTPLSSFRGIQLQIAEPDGKIDIFPGNVDTIQGFLLNQSDDFIQRTTPLKTSHIKVELAAQLFFANDDGALVNRSAKFQVQFRKVGTVDYIDVGEERSTHYWSLRFGNGQLKFDSTDPNEYVEGQTENFGLLGTAVWRFIPHPATRGEPWYGIAPDPRILSSGITLSGRRQEPVRKSIEFSVEEGQYEVRVRKLTEDIKNSRESNESAVNQILCFQDDEVDYTGQARVGLRIKASAQLQGQIQNLSALASAACPVFNGTDFVVQETSNPAWWFLWYARGKIINGARIYGGGLSDDQIDIEAIKAWALFCDEKRLSFNYVLTQQSTVHDVLIIIARAGRASYSWQTGKLGVVFDQAQLPVVAMIGPYNIQAGSFEIAFANEQTADNIVVNFINPDRGWQLDNVRVAVPNVQKTNTTATLDLEGCTNSDMAGREANLIAASQSFHRRRVMWQMDIEGIIATRGDVVQVSHDLTVWGFSGRLVSGNRTSIKLDSKVPTAGTGFLSLRSPRNDIINVQVTSDFGDTDELTFLNLPADFPMPSDNPDENPFDWAWQFDPLETPGRRLKIIEVQPVSKDIVRFTAIDDNDDYYASENNPFQFTPPKDGFLLLGVILGLDFSERIVVVAEDLIEVTAFWASSNSSGRVQVTVTINGTEQPTFETTSRKFAFNARSLDDVQITIKPVSTNSLTGQPFSAKYQVVGVTAPVQAITGFTDVFRDGLTVLSWNRINEIRPIKYEVRIGDSFANGKTLAILPDSELHAVGNGLYHVAAKFSTSWGLVIFGESSSLLITEANLVRNVLVVNNEHPNWDGERNNTIVFNGNLTLELNGDILDVDDIIDLGDIFYFGGVKTSGTYKTNDNNIVDIGFVEPVFIDFNLVDFALNFHEDVLALEDALAEEDILNETNRQFVNVRPQIRYAGEDGIFSSFKEYVPGLVNARFFDVQLVLETKDKLIVPFVEEFTWSVDVPDLIQKDQEVTIAETGITITYPKTFHGIPNVQITVIDAFAGDSFVLKNSVLSGFDIQIFNDGTPVEREINWLAQGF